MLQSVREFLSVGKYNLFSLAASFFYVTNITVGILARLRVGHFGKIHHINYILTFVFTALAAVIDFHFLFIVSILSLAILPFFRGWGKYHPFVAGSGFLALLLIHLQVAGLF